ncbi:hypothetical protein ANTQUA_LOCUS3071 [Anthophora quadrimaculata]
MSARNAKECMRPVCPSTRSFDDPNQPRCNEKVFLCRFFLCKPSTARNMLLQQWREESTQWHAGKSHLTHTV